MPNPLILAILLTLGMTASFTASAEDAKPPVKVQEVQAIVARADAPADAEFKAAQAKYLKRKIESRQAGIKAAEARLKEVALNGGRGLEELVAVKADLQAQIKDLETQLKGDQAPAEKAVVVRKTLETAMTAALAADDLKRALALMQGTWHSGGTVIQIKGDKVTTPTDVSTLSIKEGKLHWTAPNGWNKDLGFNADMFTIEAQTYTRGSK